MKYIRTQEGRIIDIQKLLDKAKKDEINLTDDERKIIDCIQTDNYNCMGWKRRVVKQADTIEELCDEIVIDCKENIRHKPFIHILNPVDYFRHKVAKEYSKDLTINVYGAIWTEWGLKYVAKMNKEGELELI